MRLNEVSLMLAVSLLIGMTTACSHSVHQLYVSSMDKKSSYRQGRWVEAEAKDFVILRFAMQTDYIDAAYRELQSQCSGRIVQVTTEHLTSFKFLSYEQKIVLKGFCQT